MSKMILLVALAAAGVAVSLPSQAQISTEPQARTHALVPVSYSDEYGHWIKCADAAGMCGVTTG